MLKLHYYRDSSGNFGDDLNPWIWYSMWPEIFDNTANDIFLGIGTLINSSVPRSGRIYVCGSGVGYNRPANIDNMWNFVFVRGPRSAKALGLSPGLAITDPAILVAKLMDKRPAQTSEVVYMPHHESAWRADWRGICKSAGVEYLDPADNVHETIWRIARSRLVLADAMHAAIIADALRVPWIPIKSYSHILEFKWADWAESLGLNYSPVSLPEIWDPERYASRKEIFKSDVKRWLARLGFDSSGWTPSLPENNVFSVRENLLETLVDCKERGAMFLSDDRVHKQACEKVEDVMNRFCSSIRAFG